MPWTADRGLISTTILARDCWIWRRRRDARRDRQHEALNGSTPIDRVCERVDNTPLHSEISDAYEPATERLNTKSLSS